MILTIGLGTIAFLFFYLAFHLDDKHSVIKVIALFFGVYMILLLANHINANSNYCSIEVRNQTVSSGGNFTAYDYDRVCFPYPSSSALGAFKLVNYFLQILQIYLFIFGLYYIVFAQGANLVALVQRIVKRK